MRNSVLDGAARVSLQSTVGVTPTDLTKLEKAASYPGPGNHRQARQGAGGRAGRAAEGIAQPLTGRPK